MSWFLLSLSRESLPIPSTIVETGAYRGDGIQQYLGCLPFQTIHSIELSPVLAAHCRQRFASNTNVHIHEGDSATKLPSIPLPSSPVLFYLDAHYSGGETDGETIHNGCPVLLELEYIANRNIPGDIIFVDDMRLMGKDSCSGKKGNLMYPETIFNFKHANEDAMKEVFKNRKIRLWQMCRGIDRLLIVVD